MPLSRRVAGSNAAVTHRCPGERITIELIKAAVRQVAALRYEVPAQDLGIDMANVPAIPASRFIITNVVR
jgi:fatty-acid peroxygenase